MNTFTYYVLIDLAGWGGGGGGGGVTTFTQTAVNN